VDDERTESTDPVVEPPPAGPKLKKVVKYCPVLGINYICTDKRCAWWDGSQCAVKTISDCLTEIYTRMPE